MADAGHRVRCVVRGTTTAGQVEGRSASLRIYAPPRNLGEPRLRIGPDAAYCTTGRWAGPPQRLTYTWLRDGHRILHLVSSRRYSLDPVDRGHVLRCAVTARSPAGAAHATSAPVRVRPA